MKLLKGLLYSSFIVIVVWVISFFFIITLVDPLTSIFVEINFYKDGNMLELNTVSLLISISIFVVGLSNFILFQKRKIDRFLFVFSESILLILLINFITIFFLLINNITKPNWLLWF